MPEAVRETLWRWSELCEALGLPAVEGPDVTGVSIDSRKIVPGDLFVALPGDPGPRFNPSYRSDRDGHDYIDDAFARGAAGVLAHDGLTRTGPQLQVTDTLDALWTLGAAARARLQCPVAAVTGSSGKTTVKSFLAAATGGFATTGSLNNHLGVPLSLVLTPRDAPVAIYEIGTNHPGEIAPLAKLARPDVAVVLNVHPAHRENFASMEELRKEKLSISEGLLGKGHLVLEESLRTDPIPSAVQVARFGRAEGSLVRLLGLTGPEADYEIAGQHHTAHVPGGGVHRAMSLAAVLCVVHLLGRDLAPALALPDRLVPAGRGAEHLARGVVVIDDSYNANPESMKAALVALQNRPEARRFALLGEMLELGADSAAFHRGLAEHTATLDGVFCVGAGMKPLYDSLPAGRACDWRAAVDDALLEQVVGMLRPGDVLLVKGSNRVFWRHGTLQRLLDLLDAA